MLNKKGANMTMKEIESKQAIARSNLWSLVHEVSKLDMDLARKLDVVNSDVQEMSYRKGLEDGITKFGNS